jgi:ribosomal protein S18 acetylase RimI-like enzyme
MGTHPKDDVRRGRGPTSSGRTAPTSVAIRDARPEDAPALAGLLEELGYPSTPDQAAERLGRIAAEGSTIVLVATLDGEIAAFGALHEQALLEDDGPGCAVSALVVGERYRRRGIGECLMEALENEARERGASRVVLHTAERRADAHAFYEALGYEHTGRRYAKRLRARG